MLSGIFISLNEDLSSGRIFIFSTVVSIELLENPKVVSDFHTVGTSIHSVSEAVEAEKLGTSYLTAGHIYVTDCKKGLPPRGLPFLQNVCQAVQIPVYGIGGIKIDEAQLHELKNAGAAGGCVMSGMMHV